MKTIIPTIGLLIVSIFCFISLSSSAQNNSAVYSAASYSFFDESDISISSVNTEARTFLKIHIKKIIQNSRITIERSANGTDYMPIGSISLSAYQSDYEMVYSFIDDEAYKGKSFYRVTNFNSDSKAMMSVIMTLKSIEDINVSLSDLQ